MTLGIKVLIDLTSGLILLNTLVGAQKVTQLKKLLSDPDRKFNWKTEIESGNGAFYQSLRLVSLVVRPPQGICDAGILKLIGLLKMHFVVEILLFCGLLGYWFSMFSHSI